jgi:hypothetical protein
MTQILYLLCAIAGFTITVGSLILIWKGRIVVDAEAKQITNMELPFGIKLQTNLPMALMFVFGGALLAFPIWQSARAANNQKIAYLNGKIESQGQQSRRVTATAVADEKSNIVREFTLQVPLTEGKYTVIYTWDRRKLDEEIVQLKAGETNYTLRGPNVTLAPPPNDPLGRLKTPIREEPKDRLDEFKSEEGNPQ